MFAKLRAFFQSFNEATDAIRTIAFWLWVIFAVGCATGFISIKTQSWLRLHGFIGHGLASEHHAPIVGYEPDAPVVVILGR